MTYFVLQSMALLVASYFIGCMFGCFLRNIEAGVQRSAVTERQAVQPAALAPQIAAQPQVNPETSRRFREMLEGPGQTQPAAVPRVSAPVPTPVAGRPLPQQPTLTAAPPVATTMTADDLKRIKGIGPDLERRLNEHGVRRYSQIAAWTAADVQRFNGDLGQDGRIQHENWIEQAQILDRGGETAFSRRVDRKEVLASPTDTWSPQVLAGMAAAPVISAPQTQPDLTVTPRPVPPTPPQASAAPAQPAGAPAFMRLPAPRGALDDLARIAGIGDSMAVGLNKLGIFHYWQIAAMSPADVARIEEGAGIKGRITREEWVEQARELLAGKPPRARVDRERDLGGQPPAQLATALRPVQSAPAPPVNVIPAAPVAAAAPAVVTGAPVTPAPSAPLPAQPAVSAPRIVRVAVADDLKRVKGIGVVIENKLRSMGITSYTQIAAWGEADIERVSQALDFRGRIERENWIDQAKILARGGQTDFSRRVDRGDLPQV